MPELIFDATVLSNFAAADQLSLLETLYCERGYTTIEVGDELRRGADAGYEHLTAAFKQIASSGAQGYRSPVERLDDLI